MNKIVIFLSFALLAVSAAKDPWFSYVSPTQERVVGGHANLTCTVEDLQDNMLLWMKFPSKTDQNNGFGLSREDERYSFEAHKHDGTKKTYTLTIRDLEVKDGGYYGCAVLLGIRKIVAGVELIVRQ